MMESWTRPEEMAGPDPSSQALQHMDRPGQSS